MANAGNLNDVFVGAGSPAATAFDGIKSADFPLNVDMLDTTDFADGTFRKKIQGLQNFNVTLSGDYEPADAGYIVVRDAFVAGTTVFVRILFDGTNGFESEFQVASISPSATVEGLATVSVSLESTGALTVVP